MEQVTGLQKWIRGRGESACPKWLAFGFAMTLHFSLLAMDGPLEYQVKAAFLLNFTKFVEWPSTAFAAADSPIAICVLGNDPFGKALDQIVAEEVVGGRKVVVRRIKEAPTPHACQALFVNGTGKEVLSDLSGLGPGVLTIGEGEGFVRHGGMIAFVVENRRVRFGINETAAEAAGLKLSSKLLNVARSVKK
jgi:hypothetical protein